MYELLLAICNFIECYLRKVRKSRHWYDYRYLDNLFTNKFDPVTWLNVRYTFDIIYKLRT